jgi:hypothetical protein
LLDFIRHAFKTSGLPARALANLLHSHISLARE